jgi:hypothetical protein
MTIYVSEQQLYRCFGALVKCIEVVDSTAADTLLRAQIAIRFRCSEPTAEMIIDARQRPLQIAFGASDIQPQVDIALSADTLHKVLLGELSLTKAIGSNQLKPTGPIWKTIALGPLLDRAKTVYPQILKECGVV